MNKVSLTPVAHKDDDVVNRNMAATKEAVRRLSEADSELETQIASAGGAPIGVQRFTASGGYTPTSGVKSLMLELWGSGGAAGGTPVTAAATTATSGGGGSGGYLRKWIAAIGAGPFTVVIGAGGTGVSGGTGNSGGASTFNDGVTTYTANGGGGGLASAAVAVVTASGGGIGAAISTNGDVLGTGVPGFPGLVMTTTTGIGGNGGSTSLGGAGLGTIVGAATQAAVANSGSGGGGISSNNAAARAGGAGGSGFCVITEYA